MDRRAAMPLAMTGMFGRGPRAVHCGRSLFRTGDGPAAATLVAGRICPDTNLLDPGTFLFGESGAEEGCVSNGTGFGAMSERRRRKKSETLEVRVEHELKDALMERARAEHRSASDIVRDCIARYLTGPNKEARVMALALKSGAALAVAGAVIVWAGMATTPAGAAPDLRAIFDHFDTNHDKTISMAEFVEASKGRMFVLHKVDGGPPPPGAAPGAAAAPPAGPIFQKHIIYRSSKDGPPPAPPAGVPPAPAEFIQGEFAKQDANNDGTVTFEEFKAYHDMQMHEAFASVDLNHDGTLDQAEYDAQAKAMPGPMEAAPFAQLDVNKDGKLSEGEFFG